MSNESTHDDISQWARVPLAIVASLLAILASCLMSSFLGLVVLGAALAWAARTLWHKKAGSAVNQILISAALVFGANVFATTGWYGFLGLWLDPELSEAWDGFECDTGHDFSCPTHPLAERDRILKERNVSQTLVWWAAWHPSGGTHHLTKGLAFWSPL